MRLPHTGSSQVTSPARLPIGTVLEFSSYPEYTLPCSPLSQLMGVMSTASKQELPVLKCTREDSPGCVAGSPWYQGQGRVEFKITFEDHRNYLSRPLQDKTLTDIMTLRNPVAYQDKVLLSIGRLAEEIQGWYSPRLSTPQTLKVLRGVRSQELWLKHEYGPDMTFSDMATDEAIEAAHWNWKSVYSCARARTCEVGRGSTCV